MKTPLAPLMALFVGILSAQIEMNYSYEMKYGDGKQVKSLTSDTTNYSYFENLLDINTYYADNIYLYTQFEYSNPPVYGYNRASIDSILSTFYIEYSHDRFNVKLGDLYELYGRGLSYHTFQDQNIDYNNSVRGLNVYYFLKENLKVSTLIGSGEYAFRSLPSNRTANYHFNSNTGLGAIDYENQLLGYFQAIYLVQQSFFPADKMYGEDGNSTLIETLCYEANAFGEDLSATASIKTHTGSCYELGKYPYTVNTNNFNFTWNYFLGPMDIYIDKAWLYYDKIHADEVFGSRFYTSIYTELFETGITYEYKNYFTPYLIKSLSNPPVVYREGSSILASRNAHSMNFGNEIGHQLELNKNLFNKLNVVGNLSLSYRHQNDDMEYLSLIDFLLMDDNSHRRTVIDTIFIEDSNEMDSLNISYVNSFYDYYPFRQMYIEINGWALSERLYYKMGMDHFTEYYNGKHTSAFTIPTHWLLKLSNGSSLTTYLETQWKSVKRVTPGEYTNHYLSISYSHLGKWIVTGFYDQEVKDSKTNTWLGGDLSYKISSETQVSLFYGSQKGGLVCANGICAEQPGFEDGIKVTFRSLF